MYQDAEGKRWWKGNLHTHTLRSDGMKTPKEAETLYRMDGYDFLALTDHWKFAETREKDGFLLLSGCEYDVGQAARAETGIYHIVSIGAAREPSLKRREGLTAGEVLDAIGEAGGFAVLAHPAWSLNRPDEIEKLRGVGAAEVYNTFSGLPWNGRRADSSGILDTLAAAGTLLPFVAADDTHLYAGEECRSFIWAEAPELTADAILASLREGRFYASQGPKLAVSVLNGRVKVKCSPVSAVVFYSNLVWSAGRVVQGEELTEASYTLKPGENFVRVEAIDALGRIAWSSPAAVGRQLCSDGR